MKLYTVDIEGIGPFASPVHIDFRRFEDAGLFLLRGPTGSGKSTLLDAIVFALYGDVAKGGGAAKERLRSTFAGPKTPSRVTLVFGAASGVYRITRTPAYVKEGNSSETKATMVLEEVVPTSEGTFEHVASLSTRIPEASATVRAVVGLDKDQFLQTIILPQGQFARFLSASSKDRQPILQSIFGTKRFTDFQNLLAEQAKGARDAVKESQAVRDAAYANCQHSLDATEVALRGAIMDTQAPRVTLATSDTQARSDTQAQTNTHAQGDTQAQVDTSSERGDSSVAHACDGQPEATELAAVLAELDLRAQAIKGRVEDLREDNEEASRALARATRCVELAQEYATLTATQERLVHEAPRIAEAAQERDAARAAEPVRTPLRVAMQAWEALSDSHQALRTVLPSVDEVLSTPREDAQWDTLREAVAGEAEAVTARMAALAPVVAVEKELPRRRQALAEQHATYQQRLADLDSINREVEALPAQRIDLTARVASAQAQASGVEDRRRAWELLTKRVESAQEIPALERSHEEATQALARAIAHAHASQEHAADLRRRWLADAAGALAHELEDGQPCLVCGATEHPAPARSLSSEEAITLQAVNDAQRTSDTHHEQVNAARQMVTELEAQITRLSTHAAASLEELRDQSAQARTAWDAAVEAHNQVRELSDQLRALEAKEDILAERATEMRSQVATVLSSITADEALIASDEAQVDQVTQGETTASQLLERLGDTRDQLATAGALVADLAAAIARWDDARQTLGSWQSDAQPWSPRVWVGDAWTRLDAPLPQGDFLTAVLPTLVGDAEAHSLAQAHAALRTPSQVEALEQRISQHEVDLRLTAERLAHADFAVLTGDEDAQLERSRAQAQECAVRLSVAEQALSRVTTRWEVARDAVERVAHTNRAHHELIVEHGPVQRLAGLANGTSQENTMNIPLSSWVLIRQFDEVVRAANPRLAEMSGGRYALSRTDVSGRLSKKHGLDLVIIDHETDTPRHPDTLSGGESFYVALSLALGLADVVSGENGGTIMESMFIDEGFGTLDEHTLDAVMTELHRLRDSGRLIGVVSHVPELARRIREHIVVSKAGKAGSRVEIRA